MIDRGELDRLDKDCSSCQRTDSNLIKYFELVQRILKVGGRFICFSFATEDILDKLLHYFSSGWFFRVHLVNTETLGGKSVPLPLFCFVLTKTKFAGECFCSLSHRYCQGSTCSPSLMGKEHMTSQKSICAGVYSAFSVTVTFLGFMLAMCKRKLTL